MKRVLFFFVLMGLGVGLLLILAENDPFTSQEKSSDPPPSVPFSSGSQTAASGIDITSFRAGIDKDGAAIRIPYYRLKSELFEEAGGNSFKLKKVLLRLFREDKPEEVSMLIQAESGIVYLDGGIDSFKVKEDQPVQLEGCVADLYDTKAELPPLRIKSAKMTGLIHNKSLSTDEFVEMQQANSEDFKATGVGLDANALEGVAVLKVKPVLEYLVRPSESAPPNRKLKLSCDGPLKIEKLEAEGSAEHRQGPAPRLVSAQGNCVLTSEDLLDQTVQRVHAGRILAWTRERSAAPEATGGKKDMIAFERIEASENVRIDAGEAEIFGDFAKTVIGEKGHSRQTRIEGNPRARFSASSASALSGPPVAQTGKDLRVECSGPLTLQEIEGVGPAQMRVSFHENVRLFGSSETSQEPSQFGSQLDLVLQKSTQSNADPGAQKTNWALVEGKGTGGIVWRDTQASISSAEMEFRPNQEQASVIEVSFYPSPKLVTIMKGSLLGKTPANRESAPEQETRELSLVAEQRLTRLSDPSGKTKGTILFQGPVQGSIRSKSGDVGVLEGNGLKLVLTQDGPFQLFAEDGFLYDEGEKGLYVRAQKIVPAQRGGMRLLGNPARLRQPNAEGKVTELSALEIEWDPETGAFAAKDEIVLLVPQSSASFANASVKKTEKPEQEVPVRLECNTLEGKQGSEPKAPLEWLKASGSARLYAGDQESQAESMHFDFLTDVHRLFGSTQRPAWVKGPTQKGDFLARSVRIEVRNRGEEIHLAPKSEIELYTKESELGELNRNKKGELLWVRPQGESVLTQEKVLLQGGVLLGPKEAKPQDDWSLAAQEVTFLRDPKTGDLKSLEASGNVVLTSVDLIGRGKRLEYYPDLSELLFYGDAETIAVFEIPGQNRVESERIRYNLKTHLIQSGAGKSTPNR